MPGYTVHDGDVIDWRGRLFWVLNYFENTDRVRLVPVRDLGDEEFTETGAMSNTIERQLVEDEATFVAPFKTPNHSR